MSKYYSNSNDWIRVSKYSFYVTILAGFFLRLQYTGEISLPFDGIDLRRSHSHLGFYGFLFPLLWANLERTAFWVPTPIFRKIYVVLLVLSTVGFALSGYGLVSHITSFFILVIWLVFAFKNLSLVKKENLGMLGAVPFAIIFAAVSVCLLVVVSKFEQGVSILQMVRVFLSILLFGVFASFALNRVLKRNPLVWAWLVSVLGLGFFLSDFTFKAYFVWAPAALGLLVLYSLWGNIHLSFQKTNRVRLYWMGLASVLIFLSLGLVENNHFTAIAGIHFFILIIMVPTFLDFKNKIWAILYEVTALTMCMLIFSPNVINWSFSYNQISLSLVSGILVFLISKIRFSHAILSF